MSLITILETLLIGPLKLIFEIIFVIAERVIGSPGMAIIALSLVVNVLMLPLHRRADAMQEESRDKEAKLKPGVDHIKKTFSGDERMMILQTYYRQNDYRPTDVLNGSVSLLLEVPFFIAAYQFLSHLAMLDQVSFGPIRDLGAPDGMLVIGSIAINVLPIAMTLINILSGMVYSKGFPLKTKIQMYGLAVFFLVVLYGSPSGLVFYWTLNNLFSLAKNVIRRSQWVRKKGTAALFAVGAAAVIFCAFFYHPLSVKRKLLVVGIGGMLMLPLFWQLLKNRLPIPAAKSSFRLQPNKKLFLAGSGFLTILTGMLIPSTYIAASPLEYVDPSYYHDPNRYVLMASCLAAGTFLVWMRVFYWLASPRGKAIFGKGVWILCGAMLVNYMFFGRNLGVLDANLKYVNGMDFSSREELLNLAVLAGLTLVMLVFVNKWERTAVSVLLTATIAIGSMSGLNMISTRTASQNIEAQTQTVDTSVPTFSLSREGKNVVVIMLDRAPGVVLPYILNEKPELREKLDGFCFYENTISYGCFTNFGSPALYGGYEYTPVEMNQRDQELLKDKHNEALKVMPVLFSENGYQTTMANPVYANYQWIPDVSIYDEYPQIEAFITDGLFSPDSVKPMRIEANYRNFFCFSMVKSMPVILQETFYFGGSYNEAPDVNPIVHTMHTISEAEGFSLTFLEEYATLCNLSTMTEVADSGADTFLFFSNAMTHEPVLLQAPDYVPVGRVDNVEYDAAHTERFTVDGVTLAVQKTNQMSHYHVNMAAILRLVEWFDYLREQGVYDNTRIIVAADHGCGQAMLDALIMDTGAGDVLDVSYFNPLLMVKDFDSHGFTTSDAFMTNADVPLLAMEGLIPDPVNPFTGKCIDSGEKYAHDQFLTRSFEWDVSVNNGKEYLPDTWATVKDNLWDADNWSFLNEKTTLKSYALP